MATTCLKVLTVSYYGLVSHLAFEAFVCQEV
jgi:hypothetical protein